MTPALRPDRQIIWDESIHTFEASSPGRYAHYERRRTGTTTADDKPCAHKPLCAPAYLDREGVDKWIKEHTLPPISDEEAAAWHEKWESGKFGPMDNEKS